MHLDLILFLFFLLFIKTNDANRLTSTIDTEIPIILSFDSMILTWSTRQWFLFGFFVFFTIQNMSYQKQTREIKILPDTGWRVARWLHFLRPLLNWLCKVCREHAFFIRILFYSHQPTFLLKKVEMWNSTAIVYRCKTTTSTLVRN